MFTEREFADMVPAIPFSKAEPKIVLQAGRGLIAFLSSLRQQFHNDPRYRVRNIFSALGRRQRLFGNVAMYPLHRRGCREGQSTGQYFVQRHPEGIEIATRIDRTIHPPSLFWCHVRGRSRKELGRFRRLALARQSRCDPKSRQPDLAGAGLDHDIGWLEVLVDQAPTMQLPDRGSKTDRNAQELTHLHGRFDQLIERLAPGIREDKYSLPLVLRELNGLDCPCRSHLGPQGVLVLQHPDTLWSGLLRFQHQHENRGRMRVRASSGAGPAKHELPVTMKRVESVV